MAFSKAVHVEHFRPMVDAALRRVGPVDGDRATRRAWYEGEMFKATGKRSSKECTPVNDFIKAMAHFEKLSGSGQLWQGKLKKDL